MNIVSKSLINDMAVIAYLASKMGDYDRSTKIHTGLGAIDPDNQQLALASAVNDVMGSNLGAGMGKLDQLVSDDPEFHDAQAWLGYCQALSGNVAEGRQTLSNLLMDETATQSGKDIARELTNVLDVTGK